MDKKIKVLAIGDGVTPTGFSRVMHSIFGRLSERDYEVHHLAINYIGDPHPFKYKIYPAMVGGDVYGIKRLPVLSAIKPDIIFMLNDLWIIDEYLGAIKEHFKPVPKVVVYFPVDAENLDPKWFRHFDIVSQAVAYTEFGQKCVNEAGVSVHTRIISHGVDPKTFYKLPMEKREIKKMVYPNNDEFLDSFVVLNVGRNQPRKRIDIAIAGFAEFAKDKPLNVKYYHHAGVTDAGWDIRRLVKYYGVENRLVLTNLKLGIQTVPDEKLNLIYNATDIGISSSLGEGFGFTNVEHAMTGAPQIVPSHSACRELFYDCGILVPANIKISFEKTNTVGRLALPEDIATGLELLYSSKETRDTLSESALKKFNSDYFSWDKIVDLWDELFRGVLDGNDNISEQYYRDYKLNKNGNRQDDLSRDSCIVYPM